MEAKDKKNIASLLFQKYFHQLKEKKNIYLVARSYPETHLKLGKLGKDKNMIFYCIL